MYYSLFTLFLKLSQFLSSFLFNCWNRVNVLLPCVCLGELVIPDNANVYYALNSSMEPLLFKLKKKATGQSSWGLCSPFWSFFASNYVMKIRYQASWRRSNYGKKVKRITFEAWALRQLPAYHKFTSKCNSREFSELCNRSNFKTSDCSVNEWKSW